MFCSKCGIENLDEARYCSQCGADLSALTPSPAGSNPGDTLGLVPTVDATAIQPGRVLAERYRIEERLGAETALELEPGRSVLVAEVSEEAVATSDGVELKTAGKTYLWIKVNVVSY